MKKTLVFTIFVVSTFCLKAQNYWQSTNGTAIYYLNGNVGIGTTNPNVKQTIFGDYANESGTATPNGAVRIGNIGTNGTMTFGIGYTPNFHGWIQARDNVSTAVYSLSLNPSGGNVGIGTTNPNIKQTIFGDYANESGTATPNGAIRIGNIGTNGTMTFGIGYTPSFHGWIQARDNVSAEFYNLSLNPSGGKVGIGTTTPDAKLAVKGKIHAEEVLVDLNVQAPDFVFDENYPIKGLDEVEAYIKANKHLPEIAPAKEMEANGVELGAMNIKLLQKVEELTLYLIEQNKTLKAQNETIKAQNEKIIELEKLNDRIKVLEDLIEQLKSNQ